MHDILLCLKIFNYLFFYITDLVTPIIKNKIKMQISINYIKGGGQLIFAYLIALLLLLIWIAYSAFQ